MVAKTTKKEDRPTPPLFRAPYNRNRVLFGLFDIVLILANSITLHRYIAQHIIKVPETETVLNIKSDLFNRTEQFSLNFLQYVEEKGAATRMSIETSLVNQSTALQTKVDANAGTVRLQLDQESEIRYTYATTADYLRAWTKGGNELPYHSSTTETEQVALATMLNLEDGTVVQELQRSSNDLKASLSARVQYDQEYLANKTNAIVEALPQLRARFEPPDIRKGVLTIVDETKLPFVTAPNKFAALVLITIFPFPKGAISTSLIAVFSV